MNIQDKLKIFKDWYTNGFNDDITHYKKKFQIDDSITKDELDLLVAELPTPKEGNSSLSPSNILNHIRRLQDTLKKDLEIESIQSNKHIQEKQIKLQEELQEFTKVSEEKQLKLQNQHHHH